MTDFDGENTGPGEIPDGASGQNGGREGDQQGGGHDPRGAGGVVPGDGLLRVRILYLSRGYIREIEIEVGRTNVSD